MNFRFLLGEGLFAISILSGLAVLLCLLVPIVAISNGAYEGGEQALLPLLGLILFGIPNLACGFFASSLLTGKAHQRVTMAMKVPWFCVGMCVVLLAIGTGILVANDIFNK